MSGIAHPYPPVRQRVRSQRLVVFLVTLFVVAAATIGVIVLSSGDSASSHPTVTPTSRIGGPNETARGNAAASAAGASVPTQPGGPNETARGNAAASASGH